MLFSEIVPNPQLLMGVKAVWGTSREGIMCFGSRGDARLKDRAHFTQARTTAERALQSPFFITIGGGDEVPDHLRGRALELVRATGVYGETNAFVRDPDLKERLRQWPVAIVIAETFSIDGQPHLVEDLGFPDRRILANAFDAVIRDEMLVPQLWERLKDRQVIRRWEVTPPPGFRDPGKVQLFGTMYPTLEYSSLEGKRVWDTQLEIEADPKLKRAAKERSRSLNGGLVCCESCQFSDDFAPLFDVHHKEPLAVGVRTTRLDDLAVLCPICHRWAHLKSSDRLQPLSVAEVAIQRRATSYH